MILLVFLIPVVASQYTCGYVRNQYRNASCCGQPDNTTIEPAIDVSGYGHCSGNTIDVINAAAWTQYPTRSNVTAVSPDQLPDILSMFVGRNSIIWADDSDIVGFVVSDQTSGNKIVMEEERVHVDGTCHFTLDSKHKHKDDFWKALLYYG